MTIRYRRAACGASGLLLALVLAAGCSPDNPPITTCEPGDGIVPDCRFQNPEDLVASPNGRQLIVSQFGDMEGQRPGSLVAYNPAAGTIEPLFPAGGRIEPAEGWGVVDCPPPEPGVFAPHGIDIEQLVSGEHALYVVNHGGREAVEMFEVQADPAGTELIWRGCVIAPDDGYFNDLVVLRSGEFRVSQMYPRNASPLVVALRVWILGHTPGFAWHWSPADGFERLPGSDAGFANGVEKSADEQFLFVNSYLGDEVIKVDTATGRRVGSAAVLAPDNLSWSPTGELLAASHAASITDTLSCQSLTRGSCGFRFRIVAIDADTLTTRVVLEHAGPPFGAATVALPFGDAVYLGTFAGDRIGRVDAQLLDR